MMQVLVQVLLRKMRDGRGVLDSISLVLALILLRAKTVESLLQRQWYLGGQQIGICAGSSHGISLHKASIDQECWLQIVRKS